MVMSFLFFVALLGAALNSVAGGGSFLTLPALLYAGIAPVSANATSTIALWPASLASAFAYRREIVPSRTWVLRLGSVSVAGGLLGGLLLVRTSDTGFMHVLPWLMLLAAVTFTFGGRLASRFGWDRSSGAVSGALVAEPDPLGPVDHGALRRTGSAATAAPPRGLTGWAVLLQLAIAIYGGYFGGGIGIMMLATLSMAGMNDIHEMNGLKAVLGAAINAVALAEFLVHGLIAWTPGLVMVAGSLVGGYAGAAVARRMNRRYVSAFVIVVAWTMTGYFFWQLAVTR